MQRARSLLRRSLSSQIFCKVTTKKHKILQQKTRKFVQNLPKCSISTQESSKMCHFNRIYTFFLYFRRDIHYFLGTLGKKYYASTASITTQPRENWQSSSPTPHQASPTKVPVLISFGCAESEQSLQNAPFHRVLERFSSFLARYSLGVMPKNRLKARPNAPKRMAQPPTRTESLIITVSLELSFKSYSARMKSSWRFSRLARATLIRTGSPN